MATAAAAVAEHHRLPKLKSWQEASEIGDFESVRQKLVGVSELEQELKHTAWLHFDFKKHSYAHCTVGRAVKIGDKGRKWGMVLL